MNRRQHARPMASYRRGRAIRSAAYHAAEFVVFVATLVTIYLAITLGGPNV